MSLTPRRVLAEGLGTALLAATVIGSGVMAEQLAAGNLAVALLANAVATGAVLVVLITVLGPISGAHLNPIVSLAFALRRDIPPATFAAYLVAQVAGACFGVILAHLMFDLPQIQASAHLRGGLSQGLSEVVATFGLLLTIFGALKLRPDSTPALVGLYITAAYWFTASTSFANPALTVARTLTDTFPGIAPASAPLFVAAQCVGLALALPLLHWLLAEEPAHA
ncbi:MAG: aquaporin family protein [Brevundimonas sp.]|nr:MAG: aquaporin family protein [Brevundimonas sp.]